MRISLVLVTLGAVPALADQTADICFAADLAGCAFICAHACSEYGSTVEMVECRLFI